MDMKYSRSNHAVGDSCWHFQWCTKYRYGMFEQFKYKSLCEACIRKVSARHGITILEIYVMPDHVHLVAQIPFSMTANYAIQLLKGGSAYLFFKHHPKARFRYPRGSLWSRGKFRSTVGYADLPTTLNYVRNQEVVHQASFTLV